MTRKINWDTMTPEQIEEVRRKNREASHRREAERKKRLAENIKIIGKKQMARNYAEAKNIMNDIDDRRALKLTPEQVDAKLERYQTTYSRNNNLYNQRQAEKDEQFMATATAEEAERYLKARKMTRSAKKAAEYTQLPDEEFDKLYSRYRNKQNCSHRASRKRKKASNKEKTM